MNAQRLEMRALLRASGSGEDLGSGAHRKVYGGEPDAARSSVNQDALAGSQTPKMVQCEVGRHVGNRDGDRFLDIQRRWLGTMNIAGVVT